MSSIYGDLARPPLDAELLRRALVTDESLWTCLDVTESSPSTNAALADRARSGDDDGVVLVAEHQTAGRGRLDRVWTAPPRSGLTWSVLLRPNGVEVARWPWLPLLTGLAVAATLRDRTGVDTRLKWPNDVVVDDRKLAGILVERVEATGRAPAAVIGIGLNVSLRADELPVPGATSLSIEGATTTDRSMLLRALLRTLDRLYSGWLLDGGDPTGGLQAAYVDACASIGSDVRVDLPGGSSATGQAVGIDDLGRLLVRTQDGQRALSAGEVAHLRPLT